MTEPSPDTQAVPTLWPLPKPGARFNEDDINVIADYLEWLKEQL